MRPTVGNDGRVYFAAAKMIAPGADRPVTGVEVLSLRLDGTDKQGCTPT